MNNGISLHIGIDDIRLNYGIVEFDVLKKSISNTKCIRDIARNYFKLSVPDFLPNAILAETGGYPSPDVYNVSKYIRGAAAILKEGDIFLLTYAGHGSQINFPDTPKSEGEFDETWCLFDRQFFDDEILELFTCFKKGVRILFISDSCHSGTLISTKLLRPYLDKLPKDFDFENFDRILYMRLGSTLKSISKNYNKDAGEKDLNVLRELGIDFDKIKENFATLSKKSSLSKILAEGVYEDKREWYDSLMKDVRQRLSQRMTKQNDFNFEKLIEASVIQISACQDNEETVDGVFLEALIKVFNDGNTKNYCDFYTKISEELRYTQKVRWDLIGNNEHLNEKFVEQIPFTVQSPI